MMLVSKWKYYFFDFYINDIFFTSSCCFPHVAFYSTWNWNESEFKRSCNVTFCTRLFFIQALRKKGINSSLYLYGRMKMKAKAEEKYQFFGGGCNYASEQKITFHAVLWANHLAISTQGKMIFKFEFHCL